MSQAAPGEAGGGGNSSHASNKFLQQPYQAPVGANFLPQGQRGAQYGGFIPYFPVKPTNPHMGNGCQPHGPMQFNMQSSHMGSQHQHIHQMNVIKGRNDASGAQVAHPFQQNPCGNVQYFSSGNYVTTLTVNPGEHHPHGQHPIQPQYIANSQNYYINPSGSTMMNTNMNSNMNYVQNMVPQPNKNSCNEPINQKAQSVPISNINSTSYTDTENISLGQRKEIANENNSQTSITITSQISKPIKNDADNRSESVNGDIQPGEMQNNCNQNGKNNVNNISNNGSTPNHRQSTNSSGNTIFVGSRPRTNSRCESVRSETGESTCSSMSTESTGIPDQNHFYHNQNVAKNQPYFPNTGNSPNFSNTGAHIQGMANYNCNANNSGNMNYQNYMACQARMNQVVGKSAMYNNPNIVQAFQQVNTIQHIQVQPGQVQIMQHQYQSMQGPCVGRQNMNIIPNNGLPHATPQGSVMVSSGGNLLQGQPISSSVMATADHDSNNRNMNLPIQNCVGHSGRMPHQNASITHGHFPHQNIMYSQGKTGSMGHQQQNMMMGMPGVHPGVVNPLPKGFPHVVVVPFGWKRINNNGQIVYVSPSGSELRTPMEVCEYLTQEDTCKCGLQCPLRVENIFCFDPKVPHRLTMPDELSSGEATKVCSHRRKLALAFSHHLQKQAKKEDGRKKRKRKGTEPLEIPSPSLGSSPIAGVPVGQTNMVPFSSQQQETAPLQQHQIRQQHILQTNQNQGWNGMYGVGPRGLVGCHGTSDGYTSMNTPHQGPCGNPSHFGPPHNSSCCDNHYCGPHIRPPFCQGPMFKGPAQGVCGSQQPMQANPGNSVMLGPNRLPLQNDPIGPGCRMPLNTNSGPLYNVSPQGVEGTPQDSGAKSKSEDGDKRRRTAGGSRPRKKVKTSGDTPCGDSAVSPHTIPGPPFVSSSPVTTQCDIKTIGPSTSVGTSVSSTVPVSGPSFMEDPNGYLAQQTVLLNNTMAGGGVGQFSPQGGRMSPRQPGVPAKTSQTPPRSHSGSRPSISSSPSVVPLPSNVPLPARVSKAVPTGTHTGASSTAGTPMGTGPLALNLSTSVHSKSSPPPVAAVVSTGAGTRIASAESSSVSHTVTVTYTRTSVTTTTCHSDSTSPQSSSPTQSQPEYVPPSSVTPDSGAPHSKCVSRVYGDSNVSFFKPRGTGDASSGSVAQPPRSPLGPSCKGKYSDTHRRKEFTTPDCVTSGPSRNSISSTINTASYIASSISSSSSSSLSAEAANRPLSPGPAESGTLTQSPLEMVQNIVSSIPVPAPSDEAPVPVGPKMHPTHMGPDQSNMHAAPMATHQVISPHVYNMGANNMAGVMYSPAGGTTNVLRSTAGSLVVHGPTHTGSMPPGVLVSNNGSMVVVTSPFSSKGSPGSVPTPVVGVQPLAPVPPVVQFVNTFATMQTPVIIQPSTGVISGPGGVLGPASLISSSNPTFVTSQHLMTHVVTSAPSEVPAGVSVQGGGDSPNHSHNRLTPVATPASTPTTPHSTPPGGSETPPSGGSSGGGRKRKRRRNASTPQPNNHQQQQQQQQNIVPAIIMGKPQHMVMNGHQLPQVTPYGSVTGAQVATVTTIGSSGGGATPQGQVLTAAPNSINVVQMVGGPVTGPVTAGPMTGALPLQPHTILVPSTTPAPQGLIINQLPDGSFVSTDPSTGMTYPVHLQLSGSHIVGVSPVTTSVANSASNTGGVVASIATSLPQGTVVAVRPHVAHSHGSKLINISPNISSSQGDSIVYGMNPSMSNAGIVTASVGLEYGNPGGPQGPTFIQGIAGHESSPVQTLLQQKTTIVAQHTTVMATQGTTGTPTQGTTTLVGTHSSVSTQTPGLLGESDVTSSDCVAPPGPQRKISTSPSHQSAEVTTTRQDEDTASTPESLLVSPQGHSSIQVSPQGHSSPESTYKKMGTTRRHSQGQEPHSATPTVWW